MLNALAVALLLPAAVFAETAPPASRQEELEFQEWVFRRAQTFPLRPFEANTINFTLREKPIKVRLYHLSEIVGRDDFMLSRYVELIEENRKKYGRISPFDRQLLSALRRFDLPAKRARLDRFERVTHELGIDDPPYGGDGPPVKDALAAAVKADASSTRYNPESGLYEKYDPSTKEWVARDPPTP